MTALEIYTDGSSLTKPRTGGAGFRIIFPGGTTKDFSPFGYAGATNNQMEIQACILALKELSKLYDIQQADSVIIYTDSQYIVSNINNAKFRWPKQKWFRSTGDVVLNATQWKELLRLIKNIYTKFQCNVHFEKVKGHSGIDGNEAADKLADQSRNMPYANKISTSVVRKRISTKKTVVGSIKGEGQRIRIRIISSEWLSVQKMFRYRCEVLSIKSKYFGNVDFLTSTINLRPGHTYDVKLSVNLKYCQIEKLFGEIKLKEGPPSLKE